MKLFSRWFVKPSGTQPPSAPAVGDTVASEPPTQKSTAQVPDEPAVDLDSIDDPATLADIVVTGRTSDLRRRAAERVADAGQLRALIRRVRGSDKAVYRILKQKCDALNEEERRRAQFVADVRAVCESLERHAKRFPDGTYAATLGHWIDRWEALSPAPDPAYQTRYDDAVARCRDVIAARARQQAEREAREAADRAAAADREREREQARAAAEAEAVTAARTRAAEAAAQAADTAARLERVAREERLARQLGGLIRKANDSLRDGHTQQAAGLRRAIALKWPEPFAPPAHLARQLQQLDERLAELKGWKDYAVAPKRLELIAAMEGLVGSTEDPPALARRIKALQAEWRTISQGIVSESPAEWERFHQASQTAYEPCREYFERQFERRRDNLEKRRELVTRLTSFEAGQTAEQTDWRLIAQVLREAPLEWRRYFPVERAENRPLESEFDAARDRLQARLDAWHETNDHDKRSLIARARHLADRGDTREAIEGVQRLQILWKQVGPGSRARDQALWCEFREVCDAVYRRRDRAQADYTAALEAAKGEAVRICEEVDRVAAAVGPEWAAAAHRIPEWRAAFEALPEMPRGEARGLHDRFERAIVRLESEVALARQRDVERANGQLFEALRRIRAYEWAVSCDAADRETLRQAAHDGIAQEAQWPKGASPLVKEALRRADDGVSPPAAHDAERALRLLCIRAEIRGDRATPPQDAPLRREYQVQRLMSGMGAGQASGDDPAAGDWDALVLAWIPVGGVDPGVYDELQARFRESLGPRPVAGAPRAAFRASREPAAPRRANR